VAGICGGPAEFCSATAFAGGVGGFADVMEEWFCESLVAAALGLADAPEEFAFEVEGSVVAGSNFVPLNALPPGAGGGGAALAGPCENCCVVPLAAAGSFTLSWIPEEAPARASAKCDSTAACKVSNVTGFVAANVTTPFRAVAFPLRGCAGVDESFPGSSFEESALSVAPDPLGTWPAADNDASAPVCSVAETKSEVSCAALSFSAACGGPLPAGCCAATSSSGSTF